MSDTPKSLMVMTSELLQKIMEDDGEITLETDLLLRDIATKVTKARFVLNKFAAESEFLRAQAKEYLAAAEKLDKKALWLKNYIARNMISIGVESLHDDKCKVRLKTLLPKPIIEKDKKGSIPSEFMKSITKIEVDEIKLREALMSGKVVDGVKLEPVYKLIFDINKD